ncbi:hypothetical protein D915_001959 [Fasciola hepatica]|uniref:Uncharacterized protein n=1 Tax=Fasciola hepatica TaxID=6192 RepID=A0A4E0RKV5_FASHE|nr:hypothetical protein D915_001959 [Fasciola hepatica]
MSDFMCGNCMKCLIIFLNVLAVLASFAMINIGAIVIWNRELVKSVVGPILNNLATGAVPLTERQVSDIAGEFHNLIGVLGWAPFIFGFFIFAASILALVGICRPSTDVLLAVSNPFKANYQLFVIRRREFFGKQYQRAICH